MTQSLVISYFHPLHLDHGIFACIQFPSLNTEGNKDSQSSTTWQNSKVEAILELMSKQRNILHTSFKTFWCIFAMSDWSRRHAQKLVYIYCTAVKYSPAQDKTAVFFFFLCVCSRNIFMRIYHFVTSGVAITFQFFLIFLQLLTFSSSSSICAWKFLLYSSMLPTNTKIKQTWKNSSCVRMKGLCCHYMPYS